MAGYNTSQLPQLLTFHRSPNDKNVTLIQRGDHNNDPTPLYAVTTSKPSKFNVRLSRVVATSVGLQQTVVGDASFDPLSSTVDLTSHGQHIKMKTGTWSSSLTFTYPPAGKMKWKSNFMGTAFELFDTTADLMLARFKLKLLGSGGKSLELLVPCSDDFLDLVVLSGVTAVAKEVKDGAVASNIADAVAGV